MLLYKPRISVIEGTSVPGAKESLMRFVSKGREVSTFFGVSIDQP
jgi:hypothetical protein